ncbi:MAG: CYTH domain-containing protein [Phycisphaerales bacterium]
MGVEIERKFLVTSDAWRTMANPPEGVVLRQGYLSSAPGRTVRVRLAGSRGYLTIKGPADPTGVSREEFEYEIPARDAAQMLERLCVGPVVEKTRYRVPAAGSGTGGRPLVFEVDVFAGENAGLVLAEVELSAPDQAFARPAWLGAEVSADPRYRNSNLAARPYRTWSGTDGAASG